MTSLDPHMSATALERMERIERFKRKKAEAAASAAKAKAEGAGDHRKRRRNRTTQSCLNCHTSKRMCDRKRPCGRCTQLGLTSVCIYEVDDRSPRTGEESNMLQQRVAELEGVINEMKYKPRWIEETPGAGELSDEAQSRPLTTESGSSAASLGLPATPPSAAHYLDVPVSSLSLSPSLPHTPGSATSSAPYTPLNTPVTFTFAPDILGAFEPRALEFPYTGHNGTDITVAADAGCQDAYQHGQSATLFDLVPHQDPLHRRCNSDSAACSCVGNSVIYSALAEAAGQLRRAADLLGADHFCEVRQRVVDMDEYLTWTLGAASAPDVQPQAPNVLLQVPSAPVSPAPPNFAWNGAHDAMPMPQQVNVHLDPHLLSPFEGQAYGQPPSPLWGMNANDSPNYPFMSWDPEHV